MIEIVTPNNERDYQSYVLASPRTGYCHDLAWLKIIRKAYGKEPSYWLHRRAPGCPVDGILPAFFLSNFLMGKNLVSLPYLDGGGIVANTADAEAELLNAFLRAAESRHAASELRCIETLIHHEPPSNEKVGMVLDLSGQDEMSYWNSLDPKVRNQVRKAEKSQVSLRWGKRELLDDFYSVFCRNMRDLGSPVHSRSLFECLLREMPGAEIGAAYRDGHCIGGLVRILWRGTLAVPWASTLRDERVHCPNNALYWEIIRFAFQKQCLRFDFGRSTKDEGTYHFKKQWQAVEKPLPWYPFDSRGAPLRKLSHVSSGPLSKMAGLWSNLPLGIANMLGPHLRRHIPA
jgi:serine/alanine adding enzyme